MSIEIIIDDVKHLVVDGTAVQRFIENYVNKCVHENSSDVDEDIVIKFLSILVSFRKSSISINVKDEK